MNHPHAHRLLAAVLFVALMGGVASAQVCADPTTEILLKNDLLPDVPSGATAVSVIPGFCDGESIASVLDFTGIGSVIKVNKVAVGYFNAGGANGVPAIVNLRIFDGVTFVGNTPVMGPLVLDWAAQTGSNIQITTHGINTFDISTMNIICTSGKLVVAWDMLFNGDPSGSCPTGYFSNFGTDNGGIFGTCSTIPGVNLGFLQGQGWVDMRFAAVTGIPLCPIFYNGNNIIRACVENANPLTITFFPGNTVQAGFPGLVQFDATSTHAGSIMVPFISVTLGNAALPTTTLLSPIVHDFICGLYLSDPTVKSYFNLTPPNPAGYTAVIPASGMTTGTIILPLGSVPFPIPLHFAFVVFNGSNIVAVSNPGTLTLLP